MDFWKQLQDFVILIGSAMVLGALFERFKQSAILGYLLAGTIVGPGGLKLLESDELVKNFAEIGVSLLLFTIGLEFSLKRLVAMGKLAAVGGTAQVVGTALLFGVVALAFGFPFIQAMALGLLVAPSSTACVVRMMRERSELDSVHGRSSIGVLLLQDLALVPLVVIMATLGGGGTGNGVLKEVAIATGFLTLLLVGFYLLSIFVLPRALNAAALLKNREILILLATSMGLGSMWVAHQFHMSPALGAFIAGMLIAESPFSTQIRADIGSLRTLFVTLFFTSVGMLADLQWIATHVPAVVLAVVLVVLGKVLVLWLVMRALGMGHRNAIATGVCLAQIGEFSFVLAEIARGGGAIDDFTFRLVVSASLGSLFITPFLVAGSTQIGAWGERLLARVGLCSIAAPHDAAVEEVHLHNHVIVIGYGPAGRGVADSLRAEKAAFCIVELNPQTVASAQADGLMAFIGDATQEDILEHLHVTSARAVVITIPDHRTGLAMTRQVACMAPNVTIFARVRYHMYAQDFIAAGAHFVIDEEMQAGQYLGKRLMKGLGSTGDLE